MRSPCRLKVPNAVPPGWRVAIVYSVLDKEVERLEAGPGAVALLGLRSPIPFDGYRLHPSDAGLRQGARGMQGGYVDAEKIVWRDVRSARCARLD